MVFKKINQIFRNVYILRWKELSIFYSAAVFLLYRFYTNQITMFLTPISLLSIILYFILVLVFYHKFCSYFVPKRSFHRNDCYNFSKRFLISKSIELIFQQFLIIVLIYLSTKYFPNSAQTMFVSLFFCLHLILFVTSYLSNAILITLSSILVGLIFYRIYSFLPNTALGLSFIIHLSFYVTRGIFARKIFHY